MNRVSLRLWDPLVRLFHVSIAGVLLPIISSMKQVATGISGWAITRLRLAVRVVWGFIGPGSARWSDFWPNPARLRAHIRSLIDRRPMHRLGHSRSARWSWY